MTATSKRVGLVQLTVAGNKELVALLVVGFVLLVAIVAFFQTLYARQTAPESSVREDAIWAAYQTDREVGKLTRALIDLVAGRPDGDLAEVSRRFDILYSRHEVMEDTDFAAKFRADPHLAALVEGLGERLHALLPTFDRFAETRRAEPGELAEVLVAIRGMRALTEDLLVTTFHLQMEILVDERTETSRIYAMLAATVGALMLAMGAVVYMIWRQLRQLEISRFRLQRLSEELTRSAAAAEAGNRAKSAFLATMSHEIRTPLNGIIGTAELMADSRLDREQHGQLGTIRQCSDALMALINDILDFSKLESGTIDLEHRPTDLADVVDGVIDMLAPRAEAKGIELVASYPMRVYETDAARIAQVLINLVGNAVKFTDHGAVTVRIWEIGGRDGRATLRVQVEDTGIGISAANITRLFTEFSQADASINRRFGGTGLGLAISKRIVEAMDGRIGVESFEGKGTIFWFEVPVVATSARADERVGDGLAAAVVMASRVPAMTIQRDLGLLGVAVTPLWRAGALPHTIFTDVAGYESAADGAALADPAKTVVFGIGARRFEGQVAAVLDGPVTTRRLARIVAHRRQGTSPQRLGEYGRAPGSLARFHGHVLVVEDNPVNRKVAEGILARMGVTTETVIDGARAVERLAAGGIDLVLMDMQMPVMDGLEATAIIRRELGPSQAVPIIGVTANAFASDRTACFDAGMNDFVVKPVSRDRLEKAIAPFLPVSSVTGRATAPDPAVPLEAEKTSATATAAVPMPVLDLRHRAHLTEEIGEEGVAEISQIFFDDSGLLMEELALAYGAGDAAGVRRVLHTLTGSAANVGLTGVLTAIAAIRAAGGIDCPDLVGRLAAALLVARAALVDADAAATDAQRLAG